MRIAARAAFAIDVRRNMGSAFDSRKDARSAIELELAPRVQATRREKELSMTQTLLPIEEHTRIRWGAVFGGAVASLGIWALLYAFGLAIGLSSIDPGAGDGDV